MDSKGLLSLPVELVQHISWFLTVEDVLACSLTCHYLRTALNNNSVWKRYLPEQDISSLETQQLVQPTLHLEHSLTPLCDNRLHFIRKTHLMNNWRAGRFVDNSVKTYYRLASGVFNRTKGDGQLIFEEDYIFLGRFINDIESDAIEVWNIKNKPTLHAVIEIKDKNYDSFYIMGRFLVVVECIRVNVYEIKLPEKEFPLAYSFLISKEREIEFYKYANHPEWHDEECEGWFYFTVDHYFISNKSTDSGDCVIHVWDIFNASKVGAFLSPIKGSSMILHSIHNSSWLFIQNEQSSDDHDLLFFNIDGKQFSNSIFEYEGYVKHIIFHDYHVIMFRNAEKCNPKGFFDTVCTVYDFNTSEVVLKERRFNNAEKNNQLNSTAVVNGTFILLCFDCFEIIDALRLETVYRIQSDHSIHYIKNQFCLFGSVYIVTSNRQHTLELWDIQNKRKVSSLGKVCRTHLYLNKLNTKLVCFERRNLSILHFW